MSATLANLFRSKLLRAPQVVLLALRTPDRSGFLMSELAEMTSAKLSLVSMSVAELVQQGLVTRRYPYRDSRTVRAYLTDSGREKADGLHEVLMTYAAAQNSAIASQMQDTK